jgi:hypothetical protein
LGEKPRWGREPQLKQDLLLMPAKLRRLHGAPQSRFSLDQAEACCNILEVEEALWTFAFIEGVEPTNNAAERALRTAVIWRKKSFGSRSEAGCEFVGRLLSVVQTVKLRGGRVLEYLTEAIRAHRHGLPAPRLLASH